jgi:hypothetical protein
MDETELGRWSAIIICIVGVSWRMISGEPGERLKVRVMRRITGGQSLL